jgi:hypothetical protein
MPGTNTAWQGVNNASIPTLPPDQSGVVVQFRAPPTGGSPFYDGHVEHVVSGQVIRFHSLEELMAFGISVLTDMQAPSRPLRSTIDGERDLL